jgi:hypothetical protein
MMKKRIRLAVWLMVGSMFPLAVQAGAPGSADRKAGLLNVCNAGPLRGEVCDPTDLEPCGSNRTGTPFECVVDFSERPSLRGTLTLVADEAPADNDSPAGNPTITMLLEFVSEGQRYFVAKTFQSTVGGQFPEIGHWLPPAEASEIDAVANSFIYQTPVEALEGVGLALAEIAERAHGERLDPASSTPVIFQLEAKRSHLGIDQYAGAGTADVARFAIEVRLVENP